MISGYNRLILVYFNRYLVTANILMTILECVGGGNLAHLLRALGLRTAWRDSKKEFGR